MDNKRDFTLTIKLFLAGVILTAFSLYWLYFDVFTIDGISIVKKLPYIRMSIFISLIATLLGIIFNQKRQLNGIMNLKKLNFDVEMIITSWFIIIGVFILGKGDSTYFIFSSDELILQTCIPIGVIQCSLIYLISYRNTPAIIGKYKYLSLFVLSVMVIFFIKVIC